MRACLHVVQVLNDLRWNVSRQQGLEAVLRLRCSQGLDLDGYTGPFCRRPNNTTDIDLAAIDCDKAIVVKLQHAEKLQLSAGEAYLQCALLYTTVTGQRRVRVSTLALPLTDNISHLFKTADLDAHVAYIAKRLAYGMPSYSLAQVRSLPSHPVVGAKSSNAQFDLVVSLATRTRGLRSSVVCIRSAATWCKPPASTSCTRTASTAPPTARRCSSSCRRRSSCCRCTLWP